MTRIAVVGAGGVGGYFGARLAAAGHDVHFLARGAHLAAMRESGLTVESEVTPLALPRVNASDDPRAIGPADLVLFAVKLYDMEAAAATLAPLIGPETGVIPVQNGVDAAGVLARHVPAGSVMGGVAYIGGGIRAPGVVRHTGTMARLVFGERDGSDSARARAFLAACRTAGVAAEQADDVTAAIWRKFIFLSAMSALTTVTRLPIGRVRAVPETRAMLAAAVAETVAVGRAEGVAIAPAIEPETMAFFDGLPAGMKASMLDDLERGKPLELPWLSGAVVRLGRVHAIPTPVHDAVVGALAPHVAGGTAPHP